MGTRFALEEGELVLYRPDGERFTPRVELRQRMEQAEQRAQRLRERGIEPEEV